MVLQLANEQGRGPEYSTAMFRAFFQQDRDIGLDEVIIDVATSVGLDRSDVEQALASGERSARQMADQHYAAETVGVSAVPSFRVNGRLYPGVLDADRLKRAIDDGNHVGTAAMNLTHQDLAVLMEEAVEFCLSHVETGGLPFVGVLLGPEGYVSAPGVNLVHESGDPSAHAEIVAMRTALTDTGRSDLSGTWLLATGEPCGLCYRFALEHGVSRIYVAVDSGTVAAHGFDYRASYPAYGINHTLLAETVRQLPVEHGLEPFQRFTHRRQDSVKRTRSSPATPTKGNKS